MQGQFSSLYYKSYNPKHAKYFVSFSYGLGQARWFSSLENATLYDKTGTVIREGSVKFKARNSVKNYLFDVSFPLERARVGMGICFEKFSLDKLDIQRNATNTDISHIIFDESFRFDKLFLTGEYLLFEPNKSGFMAAARGQIGYFNYSGVDHINFFGEESVARSFYLTIGCIGDYRVYNNTYLFVFPNLEYKFFKNSPLESPSFIHHNIFTAMLNFGLRIDVSEE